MTPPIRKRINDVDFSRMTPKQSRIMVDGYGATDALAQMIVGHDSEVVSRGYAHLDASDTRNEISKLSDVNSAV